MSEILLEHILSLTIAVVKMAKNVKTNQERCQHVAKRVMSLRELVLKLKEKDPGQLSDVVQNALRELSATLVNAQNMMQKYRQCNKVKSFILNGTHEDQFLKINERLNDCFQILSGALQIQQVDMLKQVLNAVSGDKNEITQPRQPCHIGFSNMCVPSYQPNPTMQTQTVTPTSSFPSSPPAPLFQNPTSPTLAQNRPQIFPAITVTPALNPPYPPAQRPAYSPNTLSVPTIRVSVSCPMPPQMVTFPAPPPMQGVYRTLSPGPTYTMNNTIVRTASPVVYAQAMRPQQVIMAVPQSQPVLTNQGVVTVVMNRPF